MSIEKKIMVPRYKKGLTVRNTIEMVNRQWIFIPSCNRAITQHRNKLPAMG